MNQTADKKYVKELIKSRLSHFMGLTPEEAGYDHYYRAVSMILRDMLAQQRKDFREKTDEAGAKKVCYLCMEFLMGRSLRNTLYNLNLISVFEDALADFDIRLDRLYDLEPDPGLGNGGLGRLAACYLDALATGGQYATGYSILYEYGIFRQKLVDGWQTELPDFWLPGGEVWLAPRAENTLTVTFEGTVNDVWEEHYHHVEIVGGKTVNAVPYDLFVAGKDGKGVSVLRLWKATSPGFDMDMFNQGNYLRAIEQNAMSEVISKVLYPSDNHPEGKSLRLRQQYFLVSASVQDIVRGHLRRYGSIDSLPDKAAIHINDTHPTMAIPELMRILLDECGYGWDDAWRIVTSVFAYTNHTVMKEALEAWTAELVERLLPRIYQIIREIDSRYRHFVWTATGDADKVERMAVISDGVVRMANLCIAACHSVNGVSALHSTILRETVFHDFYTVTPDKFKNVTNGIAHRRWLCQANPGLASLITELIGDGFVTDGGELNRLRDFTEDAGVLQMLEKIKTRNKESFAAYVKSKTGVALDPDSIFDVQVKRLHEYKRQHLNVFNIIAKYLAIKDNPNGDFTPHTYIFGAKAASGYFIAKKIISLISAVANVINNDPDVRGRLKVVFVEDYSVSMAEMLMPSADISEQISLAGTEASGTGNMKLMINGAITLGTLDGANIEIYDAVGEDNIIIFGMNAAEVRSLANEGYVPENYIVNNAEIRRVLDFINSGVGGQTFNEISRAMPHHDPYMVLADFADYRIAQRRAETLYGDRETWNRMSLMNIAGAGDFAADRAVAEYSRLVWRIPN
ncbi:MAG: glycogen/starch/alpha-glucan phosphorylase [Oscillospiraceae bacterium]|nr:glycogen/starch/alpha-glucan phosphorylase [Oscillospiraceae bacterium]